MTTRLPAPQAQAFVACRTIANDPQTGEIVITGPVSHVPISEFPAVIRLAIYARVTGGHGTYPVTFELRDTVGDVVWQWRPATPLRMADPLALTQLVFRELNVSVPAAGFYDLVLMAGQEDIGRQPLVIGPADMVRRHEP